MAKQNKYYTVWKGLNTGVFDSWDACKAQIHGVEGAQYKGFPTRAAAEDALKGNYWQAVQAGKKPTQTAFTDAGIEGEGPITNSLCVDAACSGNPGKMEYRGVMTETGQQVFIQGVFEDATNNIGEFLALVHGISMLKRDNNDIPIYSDSKTAMSWVKQKKCKTKLDRTEKNGNLFDMIQRAEKWLQENSYPNKILKWDTEHWGEIRADFGRK